MIQECEKMKKNVLTLTLFFLIIFSLGNISVSATDHRDFDDEFFHNSITGYSKLIIEDDIKLNSQFNASWELSINLSDQIGSDLLQNSELGL